VTWHTGPSRGLWSPVPGITARRSRPSRTPVTSAFAVRAVGPGRRRPLCVRGHPFPWAVQPRAAAFTATDGEGGSGYPDRPRSFPPLTWYFRMRGRCRLRSSCRCLPGGGGAQIIYSAACGFQSARYAGAVCPHYVLPLGYEHYGARLRCLAQPPLLRWPGQISGRSPGRPSASPPLRRVLLCPVYRSDYNYCDLLPVLGLKRTRLRRGCGIPGRAVRCIAPGGRLAAAGRRGLGVRSQTGLTGSGRHRNSYGGFGEDTHTST
jgi:hypothetical protein